jgi:hypothetical protein
MIFSLEVTLSTGSYCAVKIISLGDRLTSKLEISSFTTGLSVELLGDDVVAHNINRTKINIK